jgi:DNA-binding NarL/FixJ family response regulator
MKLMIVDDHPGTRALIRQMAGFPDELTCECATGHEAVARAADFAPDFVTMDLRMPGISGLEATREILALRPGTLVMIVSAYDIPELRHAAAAAGAAGYLRKDRLHELPSRLRPETGRAIEIREIPQLLALCS